MKEDEDGFARLEAKLDTLIRLMALSLMSDAQSVKERAVLLSKAGLPPKEIAVLWCPLSLLSTNQIVISYPYFSVYGSGYPFDATFAYAVSDSDGSLLSFRR